LLKSQTTRRTYVGYTKNLNRRLRQHNGEIKGGAKATRYGRPWRIICYISGFPDSKTALQFEWRMHHPPKYLKKRCYGVEGRVKCIEEILKLDRFTKKSIPTCQLQLDLTYL
jgi:predicted GIY-YIG superfamily endonuclease